MKKLKDIIKMKRLEKGFSQSSLAKILGYSSGQFVSNWERGESYPPVDRLAKMSLLFEMDDIVLFNLYVEESVKEKKREYEKAHAFHSYNMKNS